MPLFLVTSNETFLEPSTARGMQDALGPNAAYTFDTAKMMGLKNRSTLYSMMNRLDINLDELKHEKWLRTLAVIKAYLMFKKSVIALLENSFISE